MSLLHPHLGSAIRDRRAELGLSQEALGERAVLDRTYVSGVERGVRNPTVATLARIAEALEIRLSALLHDAEVRAGVGAARRRLR